MEENKKRVNKSLKEKKIDLAVNTNWPFIAPFLKFLECIGIIKELGTIAGKQKRKMLSPQIFTLLYILKIIVGIPRIRGSEVLLGDMGAMKMVGFDIDQLMNGLCERGDANQHGKGYKKNANCNGLVNIIRQY